MCIRRFRNQRPCDPSWTMHAPNHARFASTPLVLSLANRHLWRRRRLETVLRPTDFASLSVSYESSQLSLQRIVDGNSFSPACARGGLRPISRKQKAPTALIHPEFLPPPAVEFSKFLRTVKP